jgi:hypothetical protein
MRIDGAGTKSIQDVTMSPGTGRPEHPRKFPNRGEDDFFGRISERPSGGLPENILKVNISILRINRRLIASSTCQASFVKTLRTF